VRSLPLGLVVLPLLAVCQTTLAVHFQWAGGRPNLVLVTVLAWNLVSGEADGLLWACVGGLALDGLSGGPMGGNVLALLILSFITNLISGGLWETHWLFPLTAVTFGSGIYHMTYLMVLTISGWSMDWVDALTTITLPSALLNLALMIPVYPAARWLATRIAPPRVLP